MAEALVLTLNKESDPARQPLVAAGENLSVLVSQ